LQKADLPDYFYKFLELSVVITADHGPAVSGAHNTIVAARAGKDLVSSLISGLCTIVRFTLMSSFTESVFKYKPI
jgi:ATP citrate (pro-S)-lyase